MGLQERKWIADNWKTILRELAYHKEHREAQNWPAKVIWKKDES